MNSPAAPRPTVDRLLAERAWLQALARSLVIDESAADDLAQDAAVVALTRPPRTPDALRGWLRRVVRNLATNTHRGVARRAARETAAARSEVGGDTSDVVAHWEIRRSVVDAVLALDEPYRTTILLRYFEGLEMDEVAARLGVPPDTVKTRQRRAIEQLRARLAHLDDRSGRRGLAVLLVLARPDAAPGVPVPSAAAPVAAVLGGVAMSTFVKCLAAVAAAAALGAAWWTLRDDGRPDTSSAGRGADAAAARAGTSGARASRHPAADAELPADPALPADLAAFADIDLDRDLRGIVVDRADRPVAGARLAARRFVSARFSLALNRGTEPAPGTDLATTTSATDGSFRLRLTPGATALLHVEADGLAAVDLPLVAAGEDLRVVLHPPTSLTVHVRDADGAAVAGAQVAAVASARAGDRTIVTRHGTTGADGSVVWDGFARGPQSWVRIDVHPLDGRSGATSDVVLEDRETHEVTVTLLAGRALEGRVMDADSNTPVSGARIAARAEAPPLAVSDADGRFRIASWSATPRGAGDPKNQVVVQAGGFGPSWADAPAADSAAPWVIVVRRGFEVRGRVVGPDGLPVPSAFVVGVAKDPSGRGEAIVDATTGPDGAFAIGWFARVPAAVTVIADGFAVTSLRVQPPSAGESTVDVGSIRVAPGRTVRGRVVDAAGAGLAGKTVRLRDALDVRATSESSRRTQRDGGFVFADVAPGPRIVVVQERDLPLPTASVVVAADADPEPVTIVVGGPRASGPAPKVVLRTVVADEDGQPVANALLGVGYADGGWTGVLTSRADGSLDAACAGEPQYVSSRFCSNDPTGTDRTDLGQRYLHAHVWLRPGQTDARVVLQRGEPVSGTVVDAAGKAVARAWVEALVGPRQVGFGYTDAEGRFAFAVPIGATVDLEVRPQASGYPPPTDIGERRGVAAGTRDVAIRVLPVARGRSLDVTLVLPAGETAGTCEVAADFHGLDRRKPLVATFDARGRARLDDLVRGPVTLRAIVRRAADDEGAYVRIDPVRVDGDATTVRIVVPGFRIVRGRVVDASGAPSAGAYVSVSGGQAGSEGRADAEGRFALRLPADAPLPFLVHATRAPADPKNPHRGWDVAEGDEELTLVVRPAKSE